MAINFTPQGPGFFLLFQSQYGELEIQTGGVDFETRNLREEETEIIELAILTMVSLWNK